MTDEVAENCVSPKVIPSTLGITRALDANLIGAAAVESGQHPQFGEDGALSRSP